MFDVVTIFYLTDNNNSIPSIFRVNVNNKIVTITALDVYNLLKPVEKINPSLGYGFLNSNEVKTPIFTVQLNGMEIEDAYPKAEKQVLNISNANVQPYFNKVSSIFNESLLDEDLRNKYKRELLPTLTLDVVNRLFKEDSIAEIFDNIEIDHIVEKMGEKIKYIMKTTLQVEETSPEPVTNSQVEETPPEPVVSNNTEQQHTRTQDNTNDSPVIENKTYLQDIIIKSIKDINPNALIDDEVKVYVDKTLPDLSFGNYNNEVQLSDYMFAYSNNIEALQDNIKNHLIYLFNNMGISNFKILLQALSALSEEAIASLTKTYFYKESNGLDSNGKPVRLAFEQIPDVINNKSTFIYLLEEIYSANGQMSIFNKDLLNFISQFFNEDYNPTLTGEEGSEDDDSSGDYIVGKSNFQRSKETVKHIFSSLYNEEIQTVENLTKLLISREKVTIPSLVKYFRISDMLFSFDMDNLGFYTNVKLNPYILGTIYRQVRTINNKVEIELLDEYKEVWSNIPLSEKYQIVKGYKKYINGKEVDANIISCLTNVVIDDFLTALSVPRSKSFRLEVDGFQYIANLMSEWVKMDDLSNVREVSILISCINNEPNGLMSNYILANTEYYLDNIKPIEDQLTDEYSKNIPTYNNLLEESKVSNDPEIRNNIMNYLPMISVDSANYEFYSVVASRIAMLDKNIGVGFILKDKETNELVFVPFILKDSFAFISTKQIDLGLDVKTATTPLNYKPYSAESREGGFKVLNPISVRANFGKDKVTTIIFNQDPDLFNCRNIIKLLKSSNSNLNYIKTPNWLTTNEIEEINGALLKYLKGTL